MIMRELMERLGGFVSESPFSSYDMVILKRGQMKSDEDIFKAIHTLKKAGYRVK